MADIFQRDSACQGTSNDEKTITQAITDVEPCFERLGKSLGDRNLPVHSKSLHVHHAFSF